MTLEPVLEDTAFGLAGIIVTHQFGHNPGLPYKHMRFSILLTKVTESVLSPCDFATHRAEPEVLPVPIKLRIPGELGMWADAIDATLV